MYLLRFLVAFSLFHIFYAHPLERLVNGQDATRNQFPYMISMHLNVSNIYLHTCGGSILSPSWILTAASCNPNLGTVEFSIIVIAGILDVNEAGTQGQIVDFIVHPNYEGGISPYDIALLQLSEPLLFSQSIQAISLPEVSSSPTGDVTISGWGSSTKTILQYATVSIISREDCAQALIDVLGSDELLDETNVCTGPGVSTCTGDSGSPLVQNGVVVGVTSWGISPCGYPGAPSVYTGVGSHLDFILEYVDDF